MPPVALLLVLACTVAVAPLHAVNVPFTRCKTDIPAPVTVRMNCSSLLTETCVLRKGQTYLLQAEFVPQSPCTDVESYVAWRSWVKMPLPGQDSEACDGHLTCPLRAGIPVNFTYPLHIEKFWMRRKYPMVWQLEDDDTHKPVLCFNIKTFIRS